VLHDPIFLVERFLDQEGVVFNGFREFLGQSRERRQDEQEGKVSDSIHVSPFFQGWLFRGIWRRRWSGVALPFSEPSRTFPMFPHLLHSLTHKDTIHEWHTCSPR
jgi:hypothetical protein